MKIVLNEHAGAVWVDGARLMKRGDVPVVTIQFFHFMPEAAIEVARIQTSHKNVEAMIELFQRTLAGPLPERDAE